VKYGISCTVVSRSSWNMVYLVQWYLVLREIWYILYSGISTKNEITLYKIYHISRRTRYHCTRYNIFHEERDTTVQDIPYFTKNEIPLYKIYQYVIFCTVVSRSSWNIVYLVQWYLVLREICYILYSGISFFVKYGISCSQILLSKTRISRNKNMVLA
jgi:hypothetical protein